MRVLDVEAGDLDAVRVGERLPVAALQRAHLLAVPFDALDCLLGNRVTVDPQDAYKWVAVDGKAELTTDGADPQIDKLAKKYLDKDEYPFRNAAEQRLTVRITPERVSSSGLES